VHGHCSLARTFTGSQLERASPECEKFVTLQLSL